MIGLRSLPVAALGLVLLAPSTPTRAIEAAEYELELLVDGVPLQELAARGTRYVEALEGREYSLRVSNRSSRRIAVALAVDGLNTIDAKTTSARDAAKWIVAPWETITIDGWQTGPVTARRFFFTTEDESYGAWLGRTRNLGVVSAAVFREKRPVPVPILRPQSRSDTSGAREKAAPRAPSAESSAAEPAPEEDLAATGIGRELDHRVRRVAFEAEDAPAAVLELRYEYHDALVELGVLHGHCAHDETPLARRERARGFRDLGFAPDPYRP